MTTLVRIEWLGTNRAEVVSLSRYVAMMVHELEGTRVALIEVRGQA